MPHIVEIDGDVLEYYPASVAKAKYTSCEGTPAEITFTIPAGIIEYIKSEARNQALEEAAEVVRTHSISNKSHTTSEPSVRRKQPSATSEMYATKILQLKGEIDD